MYTLWPIDTTVQIETREQRKWSQSNIKMEKKKRNILICETLYYCPTAGKHHPIFCKSVTHCDLAWHLGMFVGTPNQIFMRILHPCHLRPWSSDADTKDKPQKPAYVIHGCSLSYQKMNWFLYLYTWPQGVNVILFSNWKHKTCDCMIFNIDLQFLNNSRSLHHILQLFSFGSIIQ